MEKAGMVHDNLYVEAQLQDMMYLYQTSCVQGIVAKTFF